MLNTFVITIEQIAILFIFILLGYFFKKKNILPDSMSSILSKLEVYVFLPALCFNTFARNFHVDVLKEKISFVWVGVVILAAEFGVALLISRLFSKNKSTRNVYIYGFTIPNIGYLGYPLITAVFGEGMLLNYMIFALGFNVFIYTAGKYLLSDGAGFSWKNLAEPSLIAILVGMAVGLLNIKVPAFLDSALTSASNCMAPLAMLMTGYVLARRPIKAVLVSPKMYLTSLLRLVLIPLVFGAVLFLLKAPAELVLCSTALLAMPMGLNGVVFPEAYGGDSQTGANTCFITHLLGIVTIPLMFALMTAILHIG